MASSVPQRLSYPFTVNDHMTDIQTNDRVVCIDATPFPINAGRALPDEFDFPGGFLEEGGVYCVEVAGVGSDEQAAICLTGLPVFHHGKEIAWNGRRFRRIQSLSERLAEDSTSCNST